MSVLDVAAGPAKRKSSGPTRYSQLFAPVFDAVTNRTYQLIERDSDSIPHCVSCAGNHTDALAALNAARALTHERSALEDDKTAAADKRREGITAELKELRTVAVDRTDRVARMLTLYGEAEAE